MLNHENARALNPAFYEFKFYQWSQNKRLYPKPVLEMGAKKNQKAIRFSTRLTNIPKAILPKKEEKVILKRKRESETVEEEEETEVKLNLYLHFILTLN